MEKGQLLDGMKAGARLKRAVFPYSIQQRFSDKYDSKNGGFCDSRWLQGFAEINLQARAKRSAGTTTLWQMGLHSPDALISLGCCPMDVEIRSAICSKNNASASSPVSHDLVLGSQSARDIAQKQTMTETMNGDYSTEHKQNDKVGSAMTGEFKSSVMGVSENRREPKWEEVPLQDLTSTRSMEKNRRDLERMESGITMVSGSGGVSDGCEDLRRYLISMEQAGKLPSSQFKGVVPQPNGRWGAQIYEKHQRVWLGTFNAEDDAARAYDRAAVKFRGRGTMTNFSSVGSGDPEAVFMKEHTKEEIVDMLRKHTYNEEFQHHSKKIMAAAAPSAAMNSAEASRWEGSCLRAHDSQENRAAIDAGNWNATSFAASMEGLPREYLFDKTVTPSDVGKLNRLVIPKQQAEKHFPLDGNSTEKGLLLDFEDNMGKVWQFRYSYWNSSQSYVLTKGWSRFVKDKKLEAGDIISFHRGSAQPQQLYISWRRRPLGQPQLGVGPHFGQSKGRVVYPFKGSSLLNSFKSGTQATVVNNAQWMPIFWPSSSNPDVFKQFNSHSVSPLVKEVNRVDAVWFNGALPFSFSAPSTKQTVHQRFFDINSDGLQPMNLHLALHNSVNPGDGSNDIRPLNPFVNSAGSSAEREPETPEHKAASSIDPAIKKGVRLFGVTLAEGKR